MIVYRLTHQQVEDLQGTILSTGALINLDVKDKHGNNIISQEQYASVGIGEPIEYEPIEMEESEM